MKRVVLLIVALLLCLCACSGSGDTPAAAPDFTGEYKDMGSGEMFISTPGGTSENGAVPVIFADDTILMQIGLCATDFDGSKLSFVFVDGYLNAKEQLANTQTSINLERAALDVGVHKVEVVQFDTDAVDGNVITYKTASYEVKAS